MSDKKVKLKEADDKFLYPKTSAWLVEGLGDYISNILNPVERTAIKDFLLASMPENRLSVEVTEAVGVRTVTFRFPAFSEEALRAFQKYGNSNLRLVLFRHNLRPRHHTYNDDKKYLRMNIAYRPRTWVSPQNTGVFNQGNATLLGSDSFSPKVTLEELRTGVIVRDLTLNANGTDIWYELSAAYNLDDGYGGGVGMAPAAVTNKRIDGNRIIGDDTGYPPTNQYDIDNRLYGLPIYQWEFGSNVLSYPDGWRTGFRIGFIYIDDAAANELYNPDVIRTVPFSLETIPDSLRRSDY